MFAKNSNMIQKSNDIEVFFNMKKIVKNKIKCGDIIESVSVNDFKFCKCGVVAVDVDVDVDVDGGCDYLRRCGDLEYIEELSEVECG